MRGLWGNGIKKAISSGRGMFKVEAEVDAKNKAKAKIEAKAEAEAKEQNSWPSSSPMP